MSTDSRAGTPATAADLVDVEKLLRAYHDGHPDPSNPLQAVAFGTSGHRGSSLSTTFNDDHIAATTQAIVEYRTREGTDGPLFVGADTHALSGPAWETCVEVLAANDVTVLVDAAGGYTPTPAVSHAILAHNHSRAAGIADGIVITPSHNPPQDGGFKYNPPNGGPADTDATKWIAGAGERAARREAGRGAAPLARPCARPGQVRLPRPLRRRPARRGEPRRDPRVPACGSGRTRWAAPASPTGARSPSATGSTSPSSIPNVDPQFGFMTLDWDGKIRMDCSSPYAMASLVARRGDYQIATGNDADADRHGIVTARRRSDEPQPLPRRRHRLPVREPPRLARRHRDRQDGRQLVDDRLRRPRPGQAPGGDPGRVQVVRAGPDRRLDRVRRRGERGCVVPAHATARCGPPTRTGSSSACSPRRSSRSPGRRPSERYRELTARFGEPVYARIDVACSKDDKAKLGKLSAKRRHGDGARRRPDHPAAHRGPRQRRGDRRAEGRHRGRLVRRAPVRHRRRLQGLRRELQGPGAPGADPGGGAGRRRRSAQRLTPAAAGAAVRQRRHRQK